ncbi:MAG TPA: GNAT family protein [Candidatus Saccharimonadales bacterium]|nr:GNAT family protein [Candidatus Saccharimonadales bacterium]
MSVEFGIVRLLAVEKLEPFAEQLYKSMSFDGNKDIALEFPDSFTAYSSSYESALARLRSVYAACQSRKREQVLALAGHEVVGISMLAKSTTTPPEIHPDIPNLGGFVFSQWRNKGVATLMWSECLRIADENHGGYAWTSVIDENHASKAAVIKAGFRDINRYHSLNGARRRIYRYNERRDRA